MRHRLAVAHRWRIRALPELAGVPVYLVADVPPAQAAEIEAAAVAAGVELDRVDRLPPRA